MHWLVLPDPRKNITAAFHDLPGAQAWLARQPGAQQPRQTLAALSLQVEAIDGGGVGDPLLAVELLGLLRCAAAPLQESIEAAYARKALPLAEDERRAFELVSHFWRRLGIAYLRRQGELPAEARGLALNRAASALRLAAGAHFLAAYECPLAIDRLLFGALALASRDGLLERALPDPDFPQLGDSTAAGHLAWAFMLRLLDPYRLTLGQLNVANRALSRWRELARFGDQPGKAPSIDLGPLYGGQLPAEAPRWLDVHAVDRKLRKRLEALHQGETPESLKLGRELPAADCIGLLEEIRLSLAAPEREASAETGEIALAFGGEDAYAMLRGEPLNTAGGLDIGSALLAHQRTALFGFDRVDQAESAVKRVKVATETWKRIDGMVIRTPDAASPRRAAPCLVAASPDGETRLGVLFGLQVTTGDALTGGLHWYEGDIETGWIERSGSRDPSTARIPAFLLREDEKLSLLLPAGSGIRPDAELTVEGLGGGVKPPPRRVQLRGELERGADFVRYACDDRD